MVDHRKGLPKRVREEETRAGISPKSDRLPLGKRLQALEDANGLARSGDAKINNNRQGIATRLADIESAGIS